MENIINNQLKYLSALLLVVLLAGCRTGEEPVADIPEFYSWDEITKEDKEDTGYGLYTYVLSGQGVNNLDALDPDTRERFFSLLDAVIGSADYGGDAGGNQVEKGLSHVFYLPAQIYFKATGLKPKAQYYAREIYDSILSTYLLTALRRGIEDTELRQRFTAGPGPFLISTVQPIGQYLDKGFSRNFTAHQKTATIMLYADLSKTNSAAMKEIVSTYKRYVTEETNNEAEVLKPLRLSLLNVILNVDNNLKIAKITL
ncbi:MAG: hypothetical protein HON76_02985 [Candidatus Scalindua sp.]|jgi:hypothetical protein|nr:hypothetical protein [Candidatus Scalindua sp.]MBT5305398.1 hypothetical protein [Candidatus Scalindua sp.]MBT6052698.1 hypothetical protein [Candidatus Scalindua sp.]MBT6228654.1 hypothetical protein [Candidatus Scalindua sp.]MBT6561477.1 hypothetical protein [Candidatus Scalindua sp.]